MLRVGSGGGVHLSVISRNEVAVEIPFEDEPVPAVERSPGEGLPLQPDGVSAVGLVVVVMGVFPDFFAGDTDGAHGVSFWSVVGPW